MSSDNQFDNSFDNIESIDNLESMGSIKKSADKFNFEFDSKDKSFLDQIDSKTIKNESSKYNEELNENMIKTVVSKNIETVDLKYNFSKNLKNNEFNEYLENLKNKKINENNEILKKTKNVVKNQMNVNKFIKNIKNNNKNNKNINKKELLMMEIEKKKRELNQMREKKSININNNNDIKNILKNNKIKNLKNIIKNEDINFEEEEKIEGDQNMGIKIWESKNIIDSDLEREKDVDNSCNIKDYYGNMSIEKLKPKNKKNNIEIKPLKPKKITKKKENNNIEKVNKKINDLKKNIKNNNFQFEEEEKLKGDQNIVNKLLESEKEPKIVKKFKKKKNILKDINSMMNKLDNKFKNREKKKKDIMNNNKLQENILKKIIPLVTKTKEKKGILLEKNIEENIKKNNIEKIRKMKNERTDHNFRGLNPKDNSKNLNFNGNVLEEENNQFSKNVKKINALLIKEKNIKNYNEQEEKKWNNKKIRNIELDKSDDYALKELSNNNNNSEINNDIELDNEEIDLSEIDENINIEEEVEQEEILDQKKLKLKHKLKIKEFIIKSKDLIKDYIKKVNFLNLEIDNYKKNYSISNNNYDNIEIIKEIGNNIGFGIIFDNIKDLLNKDLIIDFIEIFDNINKVWDNNEYCNIIKDILGKCWIESFSKNDFINLFNEIINKECDNYKDIVDLINIKGIINDFKSYSKDIFEDLNEFGGKINSISLIESNKLIKNFKKDLINLKNLLKESIFNLYNTMNIIFEELFKLIQKNKQEIENKLSNYNKEKKRNNIKNTNINKINQDLNWINTALNNKKIESKELDEKLKKYTNFDKLFQVLNYHKVNNINIQLDFIDHVIKDKKEINSIKFIQRLWRKILSKRIYNKNKFIIKTIKYISKLELDYKKRFINNLLEIDKDITIE